MSSDEELHMVRRTAAAQARDAVQRVLPEGEEQYGRTIRSQLFRNSGTRMYSWTLSVGGGVGGWVVG